MNEKVYRVLEYDKIIEQLRQEAVSPMAKQAVGDIVPLTEEYLIKDLLAETDEAVTVILRKGALPMGGLHDIKKSVRYAEKGGTLTAKELLMVKSSLRVAAEVINYLRDDELGELPVMDSYLQVINAERNLESHIDRCIESEDEIADSASPVLRDLRRKIEQEKKSARMRMNGMISSNANKDYLQDAVITMRDGRLVIPVKQENRARFPGIIHDRSATGATLFIEPQEIVNMNNEIRELEIQEKAEIARILAELSAEVGQAVRLLINNQKYLTRLDVIFAKGKLSLRYNGCSARLNGDGIIDIKRGRHPLLDADKVVPLNLTAGRNYKTLVITGPNTGGKTVTLKTVGLMMLMNQAGLHVPAGDGTVLPVMKKIFADIGDEQSIEQSLSTFSSHMKNVVEIFREADSETFVLLDELGAGTDPLEGAALAIAELEELANRGTLVFATTHYSELKKYALETNGVENASMEFDVETLSPTYRLVIGTPGRSNAFEISKKLGLDDSVIDKARSLIGSDDIHFENVISAIEKDRIAAEEARDEAMTLKLKIQKQQEELDRRMEQVEEKRRKILENARIEAQDTITEAQEFADEIKQELRDLEKTAKAGAAGETQAKQMNIRHRIKEKSDDYRDVYKPPVNAKPASRNELKIGDRVNVVSLNQKGNIVSLPDDKDELLVQVGLMKVKVSLSDITKIDEHGVQTNFEQTRYGRMYQKKTMTISPEINVIGKNLEEAVMEVDKYLDDAYMSGLPQVTVIHGRGAGILRKGLHDLFRRHSHVDSYRTGSYYEGGEGVTIVFFK